MFSKIFNDIEVHELSEKSRIKKPHMRQDTDFIEHTHTTQSNTRQDSVTARTVITYVVATESHFLHVQTVRTTLKAVTQGFLKNCQERGLTADPELTPQSSDNSTLGWKMLEGNPARRQDGKAAVDLNI